MKPKISIIIPVYNVENYLRKCIDSILNQTFKEFELILVNDGSSDSSGDICNNYSERDYRISVINKKNSGSSESRNIGIQSAIGEYVSFIDSDDWIDENMLYDLFSMANKYSSDIVISGMYIDSVNHSKIITTAINNYKFSVWDTVDKIKDNIINLFPTALINSSCNKLYKMEVIKSNNVFFASTNIGEDTLFNLEILKYVQNIVVTDKSYYHYMRYENNITLTNKLFGEEYKQYIYIHETMNRLFNFWNVRNNNIDFKINETMFAQYLATTLRIFNCSLNEYPYKMKKKMLNEGLKNKIITNTFKYSKSSSIKEKIFRFSIRKRLYLLAILLYKVGK